MVAWPKSHTDTQTRRQLPLHGLAGRPVSVSAATWGSREPICRSSSVTVPRLGVCSLPERGFVQEPSVPTPGWTSDTSGIPLGHAQPEVAAGAAETLATQHHFCGTPRLACPPTPLPWEREKQPVAGSPPGPGRGGWLSGHAPRESSWLGPWAGAHPPCGPWEGDESAPRAAQEEGWTSPQATSGPRVSCLSCAMLRSLFFT